MPEPIYTGDINKSYEWAVNTCNAPNVGYSQDYRNQRTVNGITYYDCSSFIFYSLIAGGWDMIRAWGTWPFTTYVMLDLLTSEEFGFTAYDASTVKWLPGDILLGSYSAPNVPEHTEMVYEGTDNLGEGYTMGAHGANGIALPNQVSIYTHLSYSSKYRVLLRYGEGGTGGYGISIYQAAAMLGNSWHESKVNPGCYHQNSGQYNDYGAGLWMWTNYIDATYGDVLVADAMKEWTEERFRNWYLGQAQVACIFADDLSTGSMWIPCKASEFPMYQDLNQKYPTWQAFVEANKETDLEELTRIFFLNWETPGTYQNYINDWQPRWEAAQDIFEFLREHGNDTVDPEWYYELGYYFIPDDKAYENCLRFWKEASAGGGGGGIPWKKNKHMPIWMMIRYH